MTKSFFKAPAPAAGGRPPVIRRPVSSCPVSPYFALAIDRWRRLLICYGGDYSQIKGMALRWYHRACPFVGMYKITNKAITEIDLSQDRNTIEGGD